MCQDKGAMEIFKSTQAEVGLLRCNVYYIHYEYSSTTCENYLKGCMIF